MLRANVNQDKVSVIPNALDTEVFKPDLSQRPTDKSKKSLMYYILFFTAFRW